MFLKLVFVFIGAGIGATLRFFLTLLSNKVFYIPIYGTFFVNMLGCFLIGCVFGFTFNKLNQPYEFLKLFLTTGFLGGLTTFSTLNFEVFELIKSGKILSGLFYLFISCFLGLIFTYIGYLLFTK